MKIWVSGGAGFIGFALLKHLLAQQNIQVINIDALTYAGNLSTLAYLSDEEQARHDFHTLDIGDFEKIKALLVQTQPDAILHLAAETHVDRSIDNPMTCVKTNVMGTLNLLEAARGYWSELPANRKENFRFLHVSTDEVYGDLSLNAQAAAEGDVYLPSSPYAASKAGADHLVKAWHRTYGLPVLLTHCCNNYGAFQYPEKLIPHMILNALSGKPLPLYGNGQQRRQWVYVDDHVQALGQVLKCGKIGQTYHIGAGQDISNIELVRLLCHLLEEEKPAAAQGLAPYASQINFVADRPGHDQRYALSTTKIKQELGWQPQTSLEEGLRKTVRWYIENEPWWQDILTKGYALGRQGIQSKPVEEK